MKCKCGQEMDHKRTKTSTVKDTDGRDTPWSFSSQSWVCGSCGLVCTPPLGHKCKGEFNWFHPKKDV